MDFPLLIVGVLIASRAQKNRHKGVVPHAGGTDLKRVVRAYPAARCALFAVM